MNNPNNETGQAQSNSAGAVVKKKTVGNNVASFGRWFACFLICFAAYFIVATFTTIFSKLVRVEGEFSWIPETLGAFIGFAILFLISVIVIKKFMKTKFRDFVFGTKGKFNPKLIGMLFLLWLLGFVLGEFYDLLIKHNPISINSIGLPSILITLVMAIALTWMQTSYEEIVFRGIPLRAVCGDKLKPTVKCVVMGVITSLMFMVMHLYNPEMLAQSTTIDIIAGASGYFLMGCMLYFINVAFNNLMPGLFIHWINNFYAFALVTQQVSAMKTGAIFIQDISPSGVESLLAVLVMYAPIIIFTIVALVNPKVKEKFNS